VFVPLLEELVAESQRSPARVRVVVDVDVDPGGML
jgi:hypothetical protein